MKTNFLKRMMMPMVVLLFGIAGAFVTTSMSSAPNPTMEPGYRYVSQSKPCNAEIQCSNVSSPNLCTSGGITLKGKFNPAINICQKPLYRAH